MRKIAIILGLVLGTAMAFQALADENSHMRTARSGQYLVTYWTTEQGLPQNTVTCLLQTRDGYLWAGTRYGLARFDGVRFTAFMDELVSLGGDSLDVRGLAQDSAGRLWLNMAGGLIWFEHGRFERLALDAAPFSGRIQDFCASPDGGLWVARVKGLFHIEEGRVNRSYSLEQVAGNFGAGAAEVARVSNDLQGRLWIMLAHSNGRWFRWQRLTPRSGSFELLSEIAGVTEEDIGGLAEDASGRLWLGRPGELLCFQGDQVKRFNATHAWGDHPVKQLSLDAQGQVWILSGGPIQLHRFSEGQFTSCGRAEGVTNPDDIRCALPDREGNLWVGTGMGGLHRLQRRQLVSLLSGSYSALDEVYSVSTGSDGRVWLATTYGLVRYRAGEFTVFTNTAARQPDGWTLRTRMVLEDRTGAVWAGLARGLWTLQNGVFSQVKTPRLEGGGRSLITSMLEDRRGTLWLGTPCGLMERANGQFRLWTTNDGLSDNLVFGLAEGPDETLWAGTERGGINRLRGGRFCAFTPKEGLLSQTAWPLRTERDGTLWVGTPRGLNRLRGAEVRSVTMQQGLYDNLAYCLLEDRQGRYWSFCNRGIWRMSKTNLHAVADGTASWVACVSYGEADGMASSEGNGDQCPNAAVMPNGELWFPTTRGVVILDPEKLRDNEVPPGVVIEEIRVDEETVFRDGGLAKAETSAKSEDRKTRGAGEARVPASTRLSPGRARVLEIRYTANTFVDSEKARFRIWLEGHDAAWREVGSRRVALYTNLRPGAYRFRVQACNHHGYWSDSPAEFDFSLDPHYYQTWWFQVFCVAAAAASLITWHFRRLSRRRQRHHDQQQRLVLEERSRIAKDLHDDLGANLTGLALQIEAARRSEEPKALQRQLQESAASLRATVGRMREAIWSLNPECDTLESFCTHLGQYAETFLDSAGLRCRLDLPGGLPPMGLSANIRHHLFLVAKEALHNAAKHAAASEVQLVLRLEDHTLTLKVTDNGRGVCAGQGRTSGATQTRSLEQPATVSTQSGSGQGLINMRQRIESLGGEFWMTSSPGAGTCVTVRIPLAEDD